METDNAHCIALNRWTGALLWDAPLADWHGNYFGLVGAADRRQPRDLRRRPAASTARTASSRRTIRRPARRSGASGPCRNPASPDRRRGRAPAPPIIAARRPGSPAATIPSSISSTGPSAIRARSTTATIAQGDNLYANCILALDRKTGTLKWYYQFTPHDLWDWDATQTSVLVDADWQGRPRKLMLHASRNGFFYVFDRTDGTLLLAKPFVPQPDLGERHRRRRPPDPAARPGTDRRRHEGVPVAGRRDQLVLAVVQPAAPGLYYLQTFEKCSIYTKTDGGDVGSRQAVSRRHRSDTVRIRCRSACSRRSTSTRARSVGAAAGRAAPTRGAARLSTATGLVFFGEEGGRCWRPTRRPANRLELPDQPAVWKASPMTYSFDGAQYIAVAAGSTILAFGLQR